MQQENLKAIDEVQDILMNDERIHPVEDCVFMIYAVANHDPQTRGLFTGSVWKGPMGSTIMALAKAIAQHPDLKEVLMKAMNAAETDRIMNEVRKKAEERKADNIINRIIGNTPEGEEEPKDD